MPQIAGKYILTNASDIEEHLKKEGASDDRIKRMVEGEQYLEIKLDGKKLWINERHGDRDNISDLVLDEQVEEKKPWGSFKTLATLEGNVLNLKMEGPDGKTHIRPFTFSGDIVEVKMPSKGGAGGKQVFKRA